MILSSLLQGYTGYAYRRWQHALKHPQQAQQRTLQQILALQARLPQRKGRWGKRQKLQALLAHLRQLPLQDYEALPELSPLTHDPPLFYELTSGSSGAKKRIPYTRPLLKSFTQMFLCWAHDILVTLQQQGRPFAGGQVYFSVSPQFHEPSTHVDRGLIDDSDYLTGLSARLFQRFRAAPNTLRHLQQPAHFWDVLALALLRAPQLEVISVWSPSFLRVLQSHIRQHGERLSGLLAEPELHYEGLCFALPVPAPARQRRLKETLLWLAHQDRQQPQPPVPVWVWAQCFPHLKLISAWGAENAARDFAALRADFSFAHVQEKGLLATEAPLTIPSEQCGGFLPLPQEVFYEFIPLDGQGQPILSRQSSEQSQPLLLHELTPGEAYEVVISQKSGLLRYRLKDRVRVTALWGLTPHLRFEGRSEALCDLVGEKLNAAFVAQGVQQCYPTQRVCVIPQLSPAGYVLVAEQALNAADLESYFLTSPHYCNARSLGQLQPLRLQVIPQLHSHLHQFFVSQRHMKLGDIKDQLLYYREQDGQLLQYLLAAAHL